MIPKLFAFDMDGTLLDSDKRLRPANAAALRRIRDGGAAVAIATGRMGRSVRRFLPDLGFDPAFVVLNGAEVYASSNPGARRLYYAPLDPDYAEYLIDYGRGKPMALNFYYDDILYSTGTAQNAAWTDMYSRQTGTAYEFLDGKFSAVAGLAPSKIIFVGDPAYLDEQEAYFKAALGGGRDAAYACRSCPHYIEFMNPKATKGIGLKVLCDALGIGMSEVAAYGDAENDIPMLSAVGFGAAMKGAPATVVEAAQGRVTELGNDEDWVEREVDRCLRG
jgi:Cof subfamily protein (haloacid dehalogenase superfamily)